MTQPVPMVQCSGATVDKGQITALLCRLPQAQHTYQEGLISLAMNSGSAGQFGRHHTFFQNGFQEQILASKNGTGVPAIHSFYHGKLGILGVYSYALRALQCPHDFSAPHAEHLGELNLTYCIIYLDELLCLDAQKRNTWSTYVLCLIYFHEFNLKLKPSKCSFFQSEVVCLAHHISHKGIHPSRENVHAVEEFTMLETFTQVHAFCVLAGHYRHFITGFAHIVRPLYDVLGKEVKMGLVQLPQKRDDGHYHPIAFGSHSLTPAEKNYHSSKIEFLALKWSIMEHFKEYLAYVPFVVRTDNNPLTYILTTPNLDATGHRWVGALASFKFALEYQKGAGSGEADALSWVPICHNHEMVWSLMEGAIVGATDQGKAEANEKLLCEHVHLENEVWIQEAKLAAIHVVDWGEAQEAAYSQRYPPYLRKEIHC